MDSTHSRFFIISFAFQCHLKLQTSPGELNCHNNFLFVWRFSIKAEPFVSVISPFKISPEKSSFYNKSLPYPGSVQTAKENLTCCSLNY